MEPRESSRRQHEVEGVGNDRWVAAAAPGLVLRPVQGIETLRSDNPYAVFAEAPSPDIDEESPHENRHSPTPPAQRAASVAGSATSSSASLPTSSLTKSPTSSSARPPPVPPHYIPLLRIVASLEKGSSTTSPSVGSTSSSPASAPHSAPLWSAVDIEPNKSEHKGKYGKLRK
ncbi:hypothetical protein JCM11641_006694 [Rhodosporidiobolus odoratus]